MSATVIVIAMCVIYLGHTIALYRKIKNAEREALLEDINRPEHPQHPPVSSTVPERMPGMLEDRMLDSISFGLPIVHPRMGTSSVTIRTSVR